MLKKLISLVDKIGLWILGLVTVLLNISLAFDNVVWGDEAYSQMAIINCSLYGIYERTYYWDSHPPFYYYFLRLMADLFGYKTPVYHFASLIPFVAGIILACTLIKKKLGTVPAAFFILISGLSASCVEYNLEIRMYSLVFFFTLVCCYLSYSILLDGTKIYKWVLFTLFGLLAAYTHYFGLIITGILLFMTTVFYALEHKGKSWLRGFLCIVVYIILYIPWLFVLYFQTQAELSSAWMTAPESLKVVINFICGGTRIKPVVYIFVIAMSVVILVKEMGFLEISVNKASKSITFSLKKATLKEFTLDTRVLILMWLSMVLMLGLVYGVSYLFHPILAFRYTYVLIPLVMFIFMICIKKLIEYANPRKWCNAFVILLAVMFMYVGIAGLLDFKYFRSVTKTQDFQTKKVLDIVGTPSSDTLLISNGVKHLAWSVLPYYYPNCTVTMENPDKAGDDINEMWAFVGETFDTKLIKEMNKRGYQVESWMDMWMGKYGINLYHFYR